MAENDPKLLEEIRREIIEARNLTIKADNAIRGIHAELKVLGARQEEFRRKSKFTSAVAYVLFAVLAFAGVSTFARTALSKTNADRERAEQSAVAAKVTADDLKRQQEERDQEEAQAVALYRKLYANGPERREALAELTPERLAKLSPLSKLLLSEKREAVQKEVRQLGLTQGRQALWKQNWQEARENAELGLAAEPTGDEAIELQSILGTALFHSQQRERAIEPLKRVVEAKKPNRTYDAAAWMLVQALDENNRREAGLKVAQEALALRPNSEFRGYLYNRTRPAGAAAPVATPPAQAPAAPTAPPPATAPAPAQ